MKLSKNLIYLCKQYKAKNNAITLCHLARNKKAQEKKEKAILTDELSSIDPRNTNEAFMLDHHLG